MREKAKRNMKKADERESQKEHGEKQMREKTERNGMYGRDKEKNPRFGAYDNESGGEQRRASGGAKDKGKAEKKEHAAWKLHSQASEKRTGMKTSAQPNDENRFFAQEDEDGRIIEGRNAVLEAFRAGKTIERLLIQDGCQDGPIQSIKREAKKQDTMVDFVPKSRLDQLSVTGKHQGVLAYAAAYAYAEVEDMLKAAREKGEQPFLFLLDGIEDPHNLGAMIRTANLAGAHGVIIPKRRAVGLTATVARTSAGALNYTPVARVTNLGNTIEALKKEGLWFVCADMGAEPMYRQNLTGPIGLVIGNEGSGVSSLVKEKCDFTASIPMKGDIDSLNASVAAGILAFEIVRQREYNTSR